MQSQTQIYIRGFPKSTTQSELKEFFSDYPSIEGVRMIRDYAFIQKSDADRAIKEKDGSQLSGRTLRVELAGKPKKNKGPQPNDQCRYCGALGHWKKQCSKYLKEQRRRRRSRSDSDSSSRSRKHRKRSRNKRKYSSSSSQSESSSSRSSSSDSYSSSDSSRSSNGKSNQNRKSVEKKKSKKKDDK